MNDRLIEQSSPFFLQCLIAGSGLVAPTVEAIAKEAEQGGTHNARHVADKFGQQPQSRLALPAGRDRGEHVGRGVKACLRQERE